MPRDYRPKEHARMARAKRDKALQRNELRGPSEPRKAAAGSTSLAVKVMDAETRRLIDEALARRAAP